MCILIDTAADVVATPDALPDVRGRWLAAWAGDARTLTPARFFSLPLPVLLAALARSSRCPCPFFSPQLSGAKDLCPSAQRAIAAAVPVFRPTAISIIPELAPPRTGLPDVASGSASATGDRLVLPSAHFGSLQRWELLESCGESPLSLSAFGAVRLSRRLPVYQREWAQVPAPAATPASLRRAPEAAAPAMGVKRPAL